MRGRVHCLKKCSLWFRKSAAKGSLNESKMIHGQLVVTRLEPDTHLWASMVNAYGKCGSVVYAHKVFDRMPVRDVVSWTALVSGYVEHGRAGNGVCLFLQMQREGVRFNEFALATGLKACSVCLDLHFGKLVHTQVMKLGFCMDLFVGSALVDLYAKCGEMELADRVFHSMPVKSVMLWNALLNGYAEEGNGEKLMYLFYNVKEMEIKFNKFTLSTVLKGCANSVYIRAGKVVHSLAVRVGCVLDEVVTFTLLDMYSKCGSADDAIKVFNSIDDPNVVAWNKILTCLEQQGHSQEAAKWFNLIRYTGVEPNEFTFGSLVSAATDIRDLHYSESIHACVCKCGFESETLISNALVSMYMQNGRLFEGVQVFETIADKDSISWNALLSGFQGHEACGLGRRIFYEMLLRGFQPNNITFNSVLRCCASLSDVAFGRQIHAHIVKNRLDDNNFVGTVLVDMYAKSGCLKDADVAFNILIKRNLFSWTAIIAGYAQADQVEETLVHFRKMQQEGVKPNEFTLASCLSGCSNMATLESGRLLHSMAIKSGLLLDRFVSTALVDMYGKCGCLEYAEAVFKGLVSRDTVSWNAMIGVYVQCGQGKLALEAFGMMLNEGIVPDEVTVRIVRYAYSYMCLTKEGKDHSSLMSKVYEMIPTVEHHACR